MIRLGCLESTSQGPVLSRLASLEAFNSERLHSLKADEAVHGKIEKSKLLYSTAY